MGDIKMRKQVLKLQRKMRELGIDVYVVSDIDEHLSEYVSDHFHALEEYSGFTGGDGKLVVTAGSSDADTGKDLDRRTLFYAGGKPAGGKRNRADAYG